MTALVCEHHHTNASDFKLRLASLFPNYDVLGREVLQHDAPLVKLLNLEQQLVRYLV